jgi:hypothetical protein
MFGVHGRSVALLLRTLSVTEATASLRTVTRRAAIAPPRSSRHPLAEHTFTTVDSPAETVDRRLRSRPAVAHTAPVAPAYWIANSTEL